MIYGRLSCLRQPPQVCCSTVHPCTFFFGRKHGGEGDKLNVGHFGVRAHCHTQAGKHNYPEQRAFLLIIHFVALPRIKEVCYLPLYG